jgi:hypothetical protein
MAQESIGVDICLAGGQASCSGVNLAFGVVRGVRVFLFSAKLVLPGPIKTADLRSSRFQNPKQQV